MLAIGTLGMDLVTKPFPTAAPFPYLLALAAGLLLVTPQIVFRVSLPAGEFQGVSFSETDQEAFYYARVHEVTEGRYGIRNAFSNDYKDKPILHLGGLEMAFGIVGRVTGIHIDNLMILVKLSLGALAFLALYRFEEQLTSSPWAGAAAASTVLFATDAVLRPWLFFDRYLNVETARFLFFSRPIQPAGGTVFLFGTIAALFFWSHKRTRASFFVFACLLAASFYVYLYAWTFLLAFLGLLVLFALWSGDRALAKGAVVATCIGLVLASYLFYELAQALMDPDYAATTSRFGGVGNRYPVLGVVAPLCAVLAFFVRSRQRALVLAMGLTPLVVLNQQLLTGRTFHSGHYHWYVHEPLLLLFAIAIFHQLALGSGSGSGSGSSSRWTRMALPALTVVAFALGATKQVTAYIRWHEPYEQRQSLGEVYAWMNEHMPTDSVVLAEELEYLAAYTDNNSYLNLPWTLVPQERLIEDFYVRKFFFGNQSSPMNGSLEEKREMAMHVFAGHYHQDCAIVEAERLDVSYPCYDDERLAALYARYERFDAKTVLELASRYGLEYVLATKDNRNSLVAGMPVVFENEDYAVYEWEPIPSALR
jgi:hypothetical protein